MVRMIPRTQAAKVRFGLLGIGVLLCSSAVVSYGAQSTGDPPATGKKVIDLKNLRQNFAGNAPAAPNRLQLQTLRRCATSAPVGAQRLRSQQVIARLRLAVPDLGQTAVVIPVRFIVIHEAGVGNVTDARLAQQVSVLNETYAGTGFTFKQISVERHDVAAPGEDPEWFRMTYGGESEIVAKEKWGKDQATALNFYTAEPRDLDGAGLLGWATFPSELTTNRRRDGVVILHSTLPGGETEGFNLGKTATHEVGHWLGLFHTFEGGCAEPGDEVDDTTAQAFGVDTNNNGIFDHFECVPGLDTCPEKPGMDPIHNYMNYPPDACMTEFTPKQVERMRYKVAAYRHALIAPGLPAATRTAITNAVETLKK